MPRIRRTQKQKERFLIRELLGHLGYKMSNPKWTERPDAMLTLRKGTSEKRVGIEHTGYHNDAEPGTTSPVTWSDEFWRKVQSSLVSRVGQRRHLRCVSARVWLTEGLSKPDDSIQSAKQLAKEIIEFVEDHPPHGPARTFWRCRDFGGQAAMEDFLKSITISRVPHDPGRAMAHHWRCSDVNAGNVGLDLAYVGKAMKKKSEKAANYNWEDADEKWLLIAASGETISDGAGPLIGGVNWATPEMVELCRESPFDRIIFWERIAGWYKWIKPDQPAEQY